MTKVFLIRHAEAEGNLFRRVQGSFDGQITLQGELQIAALAERFRDLPLDAVYSSDLSRARRTAGALVKYGGPQLVTDPRLREINMGIWENRPWGEVEHENREQIGYFMNDPERWSVPDAESFPALSRRIREAVLDLAARHDGKTIAAVSHGMAIRSLLCGCLGVCSADVSSLPHGDNTCVALLEISGGDISVIYYNDNSHLPREISTFAKQTWWKKTKSPDGNNLRFAPLRLPADAGFYTGCYAGAWANVHGSLRCFDGADCAARAARRAALHPEALMTALCAGSPAGIIDLDVERESESGAGWISFLYVVPEYRGRNFGIQLIGHAVTVFRELGRRTIRLNAAEPNAKAVGFYEHYGFRKLGIEPGAASPLYLMELKISPGEKV